MGCRKRSAMPKAKDSKKTPAPSPYEDPKKKAAEKVPTGPLWEKKPKNWSIGGGIQPKVELGRFVKWPKYVQIQRQRKILYQRLKVPPSVNQFTRSLSKDQAKSLFSLMQTYKPEDRKEKRARQLKAAQEDKATPYKKPLCVQYGLNHVTSLIEQKKATLVAIASDVDPVELVVWMPALCRRMGVAYCIVKNKSRLGKVVDKKTATCVAFTKVDSKDDKKLAQLKDTCLTMFNNNTEALRTWGGGVMGLKTQKRLEIRARMIAEEAAKKAKY